MNRVKRHVRVIVAKAEGIKCPRCWFYTGEGRFNYDGLCDKCVDALLHDYPEHGIIPFILQAKAKQREQWEIMTTGE
jgi:hypothetical protein